MQTFKFDQKLTVDTVYKVSRQEMAVKVPQSNKKEITKKFKELETVSKDKIVYGVNTGFGPMVHHYVPPQEQTQLQYNLVRSHACGLGPHLAPAMVRAIMLARLSSLLKGYSGVSVEVLTGIERLIQNNIIPRIPQHGSVGASGDLIQLSHIALCLIGEGDVVINNQYRSAKSCLKKKRLQAVTLKGRDGLALINGTGAMTGVGALVLAEAKQLVYNSIRLSALLYELFSVNNEHISPVVGNTRPHHGQIYVAKELRSLLKNSKNVVGYQKNATPEVVEGSVVNIPQQIYSLRCAPQIIGPILDTILSAISVVEIELNAVTDNPLFSAEGPIHNGNFHGDYVSHEMDKVRIALTKLSMLQERQLSLLSNPAVNCILPPYLNRNRPGLDLALQAVQFVATSNTAENQTLATPMVTHSIPTNNDNQDVVSMGCNSALLTQRVLENAFEVQAALSLAVIEAVDIKQITLTSTLNTFYNKLRSKVAPVSTDRPLTNDLEQLATVLKK